MGKMLSQLNKKLQTKADKKLVQQKENVVDKYEKYDTALKNNQILEVTFDVATESGDLVYIDEHGLKVILSEEIFSSTATYYKPSIRSKFIGIKMSIRVKSIDKENGLIIVKSARGNASTSRQVISELRNELAQGQKPTVYGVINYVSADRAFVKICGLNVDGMIYVADWSSGYTRFLNEHCHKGDILPFSVVGTITRRSDSENIGELFRLTHDEFAVDPWEQLDSQLIQVGSIIFVKCVSIPTGKTYWWGSTKVAPGIELLGNFNRNLNIVPGVIYKCKVRKYKPERKMLQVTPFEISEE